MRKYIRKISIASLFIMSMAFLSGCSSETPTESVETFLMEVKKGEEADPEIVGSILDDNISPVSTETSTEGKDLSPEIDKEMSKALSKLEYKVNSEKIDGDNATVNVTLNSPDVGSAMLDSFKEVFNVTMADSNISEEDLTDEKFDTLFNEYFLKSLKDVKYTEQVGDILLEKQDDYWEIVVSDELTKLLYNIDSETYNQIDKIEVPEQN